MAPTPPGEVDDIRPFRVRCRIFVYARGRRPPGAASCNRQADSGLDDPSSQVQDCREFDLHNARHPLKVAACGRRCRVNRLIIR
jgi:hypothetical protein